MSSPLEELAWLGARLGEARAELLWPHVEWAEQRRLMARHGYPSDNALPLPLVERLQDPVFIEYIRESIDDEADEEAASALGHILAAAR